MTPEELPQRLPSAGDAEAVEAAARALYGRSPGPARGVLHVVAVWRPPSGPLRVIRVGPESPKSAVDFFALNLARARAGAVVATGRILREEPELRYDLPGPGALPGGLLDWRLRVAGLAGPPRVVVLTSGRELDFSHPAFSSWARPVIFTGEQAAARLSAPEGVEVVGHPEPSLAAAVGWLRGQGADGISIEAGPSTAMALYRGQGVDELMLSIYEGPLASELVGGEFLTEAALEARFETLGGAAVEEESGRWCFSLRRPPRR